MEALGVGKIPSELETLTETDRLNEYIMTSLRTTWGLDLDRLNTIAAGTKNMLNIAAREYFEKGWIQKNNQIITLTQTGKLYADTIAAGLFF